MLKRIERCFGIIFVVLLLLFYLFMKMTFSSSDGYFGKFNPRYYFQVPDFIKNVPKISNDFDFDYRIDPDYTHMFDISIRFKQVENKIEAKKILSEYVIKSGYRLVEEQFEHLYITDDKGKKVAYDDKVFIRERDDGYIELTFFDYANERFSNVEIKIVNQE